MSPAVGRGRCGQFRSAVKAPRLSVHFAAHGLSSSPTHSVPLTERRLYYAALLCYTPAARETHSCSLTHHRRTAFDIYGHHTTQAIASVCRSAARLLLLAATERLKCPSDGEFKCENAGLDVRPSGLQLLLKGAAVNLFCLAPATGAYLSVRYHQGSAIDLQLTHT